MNSSAKFSDLVYADGTAFLVNTTSDAVSSLQLSGHRFSPRPADILAEDKAAKSRCRPPTTICFSRRHRQYGQFRLLGKSTVLGWPLPATYQQTHRPGLISYVCSVQHHWKDRYHLSISTKIRIYQALVQSVLLYAAETWTPLATDIKALEAFHMNCQRHLPQISWQLFL